MGAHSSITESPKLLILFDGVCNLCNGAVQFIIKRDRRKKFSFASLQSATAKQFLTCSTAKEHRIYSIILIKDGKQYERSDAILEIARELDGFWSLFYSTRFIPRFLRDALYTLVANNRYRLFGKKDSCLIPTPELKARFLD